MLDLFYRMCYNNLRKTFIYPVFQFYVSTVDQKIFTGGQSNEFTDDFHDRGKKDSH